MEKKIFIYLAGNIRKGKEEEKELVWTEEDQRLLQQHVPNATLIFLNPAHRSDDLSDQLSVFGRDMFQVFSSDLVFVDARGKRGLGVGAEMMFAKMNRIPVVSWLPEKSHYHRASLDLLGQQVSNWIHPFVQNLSDCLAPNLLAAARWIREELATGRASCKGPEHLSLAMAYYQKTQLPQDAGMKELVSQHEQLAQKLESSLEVISN